MKAKIIKDVARVTYKGHVIRKIEDEFGNVIVLIDNDSHELENAPKYMAVNEFQYASIADAKRAINCQPMHWVSEEAEFRPEYFTRFKKKEGEL